MKVKLTLNRRFATFLFFSGLLFATQSKAVPMYCDIQDAVGKTYYVSNIFEAERERKPEIENSYGKYMAKSTTVKLSNVPRCVRFDSDAEAEWSRNGWTGDLKKHGYSVFFIDWSY